MKKEDLFENLNDVKDEYVSEATEKAKKPTHWVRWGAVAACAAIAIFAGTRLGGPAGVTPTQPPVESSRPTAGPAVTRQPMVVELPLLTVEDFAGAFGFEGYLAYSPDELLSRGPWDGEVLDTLPVYKNQAPTDPAGFAEGDRDALEAQVRDIAARLGITEELTITDDLTPQALEKMGEDAPQGPSFVKGTAEGVEIEAYAHQMVQVEFDPALALPEGLRMDESDQEALETAGEYLKTAYADLLDMEEPVVDVRGGDYSFRGDRTGLDLYLYDAAGDQQIVGHDLKSAWFCADEENKLWLIWLDAYDLSEKVGDYPIITAQEATDLLCGGNYITTVPAEMPGREKIVRTELMYRTERTAEYFMPYYRFLVELDDPDVVSESAAALGLKTYGAYYVPAVAGEYLTEMPVWDGSFN